MERNVRLGEVSHLVMTFLHDERTLFPATRAAFEHEARDALNTLKPGRRGVKTLYEILDEYLELKQESKDREDRKACFRFVCPTVSQLIIVLSSLAEPSLTCASRPLQAGPGSSTTGRQDHDGHEDPARRLQAPPIRTTRCSTCILLNNLPARTISKPTCR